MRKEQFSYFFISVILALSVASCMSEVDGPLGKDEVKFPESISGLDKLNATLDVDFLEAVVSGEESAVFQACGSEIYDRSNAGDGGWLAVDLDGVDFEFPNTAVFKDACLWRPVSFFTCAGHYAAVNQLWRAYRIASGMRYELYLRMPVEVDAASRRMRVDGKEYMIHRFDRRNVLLSYSSEYTGGDGGMGGVLADVMAYGPAEDDPTASHLVCPVDNMHEAIVFVITKARDFFGPEVDLNRVFAPDIILDHPILDIDALAEYYGVEI